MLVKLKSNRLRNSKIALIFISIIFIHYLNQVFESWLSVHGYSKECDALKELPKDNDLTEENALKFCSIIHSNLEPSALELFARNLRFQKEWNDYLHTIDEKSNYYEETIIDYHMGFERLKSALKDDVLNMPALKVHLESLSFNYLKLFQLNPNSFITYAQENCPISILLMMTNGVLRNEIENSIDYAKICEYLRLHIAFVPGYSNYSGPIHNCKRAFYKYIFPNDPLDIMDTSETEDTPENEDMTENNVITLIRHVCKDSEMWEDPEPYKDKRFMVLYCPEKADVRPYRDNDGILKREDLTKFPIINGLEYRSANKSEYLIYMEV
jgi:hypothetical protein